REVTNARRDRDLQDLIGGGRRSRHLVLDQLVDPRLRRGALVKDETKERANEILETLLRGAAFRRVHRERIERADLDHRIVHDLEIQAELVAEVVVHEREIGVGLATDVADGDALETLLREEALRRFENPTSRVIDTRSALGAFLRATQSTLEAMTNTASH